MCLSGLPSGRRSDILFSDKSKYINPEHCSMTPRLLIPITSELLYINIAKLTGKPLSGNVPNFILLSAKQLFSSLVDCSHTMG